LKTFQSQKRRIASLEQALLEYVEKYGLTEKAREAMKVTEGITQSLPMNATAKDAKDD
jgi:hypothetical protein